MAASGGGEHPNGRAAEDQQSTTSADPLGDFAADLGNFLGGVQSRAASWLEQRKGIADQLTQIRDTANQYLQQLAGGEQVTTPSMLAKEVARRGRPPGSKNAKRAVAKGSPAPGAAAGDPARPKKRFMSAEARARIAAAQRKRWAKVRKAARNADR
jgi:hypothetical protein